MKFQIPNCVKTAAAKVAFQWKKHGPEVLMVSGIAGLIGGAVVACTVTYKKLPPMMDKLKEDSAPVKEHLAEKPEDEQARKDLGAMYIRTGVQVAAAYLPAIGLGVLGVSGILAGNSMLRKQAAALAAAYTAIDKSFKSYRERLAARFGEDAEREIRYGLENKTVEETVVDDKGKEKKVKKTVPVAGQDTYSPYARFFDESCGDCYSSDPQLNLMFLKAQQQFCNDKLRADGYLLLNDVYKMLGMPVLSVAGSMVGWIYDKKNPNGDNYVDFGLTQVHREAVRDFVNGIEPVILLDFNVDGPILDAAVDRKLLCTI